MTDIENLYERYAGDVRRFALYLCGDVVMADEITSDTFVRAWTAADRIRQPTVKSYLFTIARNAYTDLFRRAARHTQLDENMPDAQVSVQAQMELSAEVCAVLAALQQLPEMDVPPDGQGQERTVFGLLCLRRAVYSFSHWGG